MKPTLSCLAAAAICAALSAQSTTSPIGMQLTEGTSGTAVLFGSIPRRFQQLDSTLRGSGPRILNSISFRRDGDRAVATATARTLDVKVTIGHGDAMQFGPTFDGNYLVPPTVARSSQVVNFPDWTAAVPGPAAFDFTIVFDAPFAYNGIDPLVWDLTVQNSSQLGQVWVDRLIMQAPFGYDIGAVREPGCTVGGETEPFRCAVVAFNYGPNHPLLGQRIVLSGSGLAPDTPVAVDICLPTPSIPLPGFLCAPFQSDLVVNLSMGVSSPTGYTTDLTVDVEYNPLLDGVALASQALSLDATQAGLPLVVSDIRTFTLPSPVETLDCHYVYAGPTDLVGTLYPNRAVIALFQ